jgi:arginine repressor
VYVNILLFCPVALASVHTKVTQAKQSRDIQALGLPRA